MLPPTGTRVAESAAGLPPDLRVVIAHPSGEPCIVPAAGAGDLRLEEAKPARAIPSYRGQRNFPGYWWSATTGRHVVFESWLERHHLMAADRAADVVGLSSQPCLLVWWDGRRRRRHAPDLFLRHADDTATVLDCRPTRRRDERFATGAAVTAAWCAAIGWSYAVAGEPDPVPAANLRWLAGYRHRRFDDPLLTPAVLTAYADSAPLLAGARMVGDEIAVLPLVYHLLWTGRLRCDERRPLTLATVVDAGGGRS